MSFPPHGDPAAVKAVRDCLADQFAQAMLEEEASVKEILEHRIGNTQEREKWRPIHDAIEIIRTMSPRLREKLDAAIRRRFDAKVSPEPGAFSTTALFSASALSLVSEDEVQEEIAIGNTTRRLREAVGDEFYALNARLAFVMGLEKLSEERSPAHPRLFVRALLDAITEASPDIASRLIAFSAQDPALLQALPAAYRAANAILVSQGVLPHLRRSYGAPEQVPGVHAVVPGAPIPTSVPVPAAAKPTTPPAPPASTAIFDQLLAKAAAPTAGEGRLMADLVSAMFDRLLVDSHLTAAARAQLARLRPIVSKAVIADQRVFTEPDHPIRGLIDAMVDLGESEGAQQRIDGLLPEECLAAEVQALLDGNRFDAASIAAARDRLADLARRHHEAFAETDAVVRNVRREDEEFAAVQESALELAHRISAAHCSEAAANFAYRTWRPVLIQTHRAHGHASSQWNADLETVDELLWTLVPHAMTDDHERLATLMTSARHRVLEGLMRAKTEPAAIEAAMAELDGMHANLRRSPGAAAAELTQTAGLGPRITEDVTATLHVTSQEVRDEGLERGAWFEFSNEDGTVSRVRLNWVSPVQGACVFKDLASNRSFAISLVDLRARRAAGRARPVDGPGVARASIEAALQDVAGRAGRGSEPSQPR